MCIFTPEERDNFFGKSFESLFSVTLLRKKMPHVTMRESNTGGCMNFYSYDCPTSD